MPIFRHRAKSAPAVASHAGDDRLLAEIQSRSDPLAPRHWVHYLYCADENAARHAATEIAAAGWTLQRVDVAAQGTGWVVIAEKHNVVTSPSAVCAARTFFEGVASRVEGGDYDGWEASL